LTIEHYTLLLNMENIKANETYDQAYWDYQQKMGEFGGWANKEKFQKFIKSTDKVIDFGCGGGYLLRQLKCADKIGIEVNEKARAVAKEMGIRTVAAIEDIPDNWADIIISNHVLEHTIAPLDEILSLKNKLKPEGKIIFVVPSEGVYHSYDPNDPNHHLYTWSPMCLGNLFHSAGFKVLESKAVIHRWPPKYRLISKFGSFIFNMCCSVYGFITSPNLAQSRVIAQKVYTS